MNETMNPSIAIIIVNYNGFEDTVECIKSLKACTYDNYEIVVVDNASSVEPVNDDIRYIKENAIFIEAKSNDGFAAGNNIGIKWALERKFDLCLLINNDTTVEPSFLTCLVKTYKSYPNVGIIGGRICFFNDKNRIWYGGGHIDYVNGGGQHEHYRESFKPLDTVREVQFITGCLMMIPSKVFETVGLLDESFFLYEEDTELCLRVAKHNYNLLYDDKAVIYHKISASTQKNTTMKNYYELRNKFIITKKYYPHACIIHFRLIYRHLKDFICRRKDLYSLFYAYFDYKRGVVGKRLSFH